jgi:hypothetical protein
MTIILSNLVLVAAILVGSAGVAVLFRVGRLVRQTAGRTLHASAALLIFGALFFSACTKDDDGPATDAVPVLDQATLVQDTLFLTGKFGPDPGAVLVNGQALPAEDVVSWRDDKIVCIKRPPVPAQIVVEVVVENRKSQPKIITVSSDFRITYLIMDEENWVLYIFGNFGPDPGPGNRSVKVNNVELGADNITEVELWAPTVIKCIIPSTGPASSGEVVVSKGANLSASRILNVWKGELLYTRPQGGPGGSLVEHVWFNFTFRGDSGPMPEEAKWLADDLRYNFHDNTSADYEAMGSADCSYTMDGCASVNVNWQHTTGWLHTFPHDDYSTESYFNGYIHPVSGGFDVEIFFQAWEVTPSTVTTSPCSGDPFVTNRKESIQFDAFTAEIIPIRFEGNNIKAGSLSKSGLSNNGALTWDFTEAQNHLVTATLEWETMTPLH